MNEKVRNEYRDNNKNVEKRKITMSINYEPPSSRLSILQDLSSIYPPNFLKDFFLIGCQHLLPSTHLMLRSCFDMGLKPERTALIGKCYSTSPKTKKLMKEEGVYVCSSSAEFNSHQSYDEQFYNNISAFFHNALKHLKIPRGGKLIVLDDGGELISLVNAHASHFERVIGVEQTSAGYHKLSKVKLVVPVINVARCSAKLVGESPMVGEAQVYQMRKIVDRLGLSPQNALIIGNGALGQCLALAFQSHYNVVCYDKSLHKSDVDKKSLNLSQFDLIIGATGEASLSLERNPSLKEGVVLASVSSSDREFEASFLRKKIEKVEYCHENLFVDGIHLLNCGFPLNFQGGDKDSVPIEKIQLVIALLFAAIFQGVSRSYSETGFCALDYNYQRIILDKLSMLPLMKKESGIAYRAARPPQIPALQEVFAVGY